MFSKPFKVKSNSQLKGSERKKFRQELLKNFSYLTEEHLQELVPNKEVVICMKIYTHSSELVLIYCVQKLPIVFEVDKQMYPTVYVMWKIPNLLYAFTTWPQVLPKITGGADLMLPGVVLKEEYSIKAFGKLEKGARVAVNLSTNSAAIAVGRTTLSSMDMYMSAKRGKAVHILHYIGDELWGWGTKLNTPDFGPPPGLMSLGSCEGEESTSPSGEDECVQSSKTYDVMENLAKNTLKLNIDTDVVSEDTELENVDGKSALESSDVSGAAVNEDTDSVETETLGNDLSEKPACSEDDIKKAMDDLVQYCFLKALNTTAKKAEYPMLSSKFYKLHMLPSCPVGKTIDIKRSSYKKLSVFLNTMSSAGVVNVKELTKGVESIMNINPNHELLRTFVDEYNEEAASSDSRLQMTVLDANSRPEITEMYVVTAAVLPIFTKFDFKKGASLPVSTVRKYVTEYVKLEGLHDTNNRRSVKLNGVLSSALNYPSDVTSVVWDELFSKVFSKMTRSYQMSFSGQNPVFSKGKLEPIDIQVGKRTGNKKVTLINNLELYGVNLSEFARECQHGVAASTSISTVPGKKSAQLMVQGNQVLFVGNLLMGKYQIPKRYIRGLENAPKQKK